MPALANAQSVPASLNAKAIIALTNVDRVENGEAPLTEDARLDFAAQQKADDEVANGYFAHTSPSGKSPWYWLIADKYYYLDAGENLAAGFGSAPEIETAWMHSPEHRANLLSDVYTNVGIGLAEGMYEGKETTYVVQLFTTPYVADAQKSSGALAVASVQ